MRTYLLEKSRVVFQVGKMRRLSVNVATNLLALLVSYRKYEKIK